MSSPKIQKSSGTQKPLVVLVILLLVVAVVAGLELTNTTHLFHKQKAVSGTIPSTTKSKTSQNTTNTAGNSTGSESSNNSTPTGPAPQVPTGDFVSSHHPTNSSSEASTCNTTPGATCYIEFTQGSVVKKLATQTIGGDGGTIWYWNIGDAGLTSGSWKITAVATLNGQTRSADDALPLEVQ